MAANKIDQRLIQSYSFITFQLGPGFCSSPCSYYLALKVPDHIILRVRIVALIPKKKEEKKREKCHLSSVTNAKSHSHRPSPC